MTIQLSIEDAMTERDAGIQKAVSHADQVNENWSEKAFKEFKSFLLTNPGEFMAESFRAHCAMKDFPLPPSARAFGGVIVRAYKAGLIRRVRFDQVSNKRAHACFASVWIKNK